MTALAAWREGIRLVNRAPAVLLGTWLMTIAVTLPPAVVMRSQIEQHLGGSLVAGSVATGVNRDWMEEFSNQATGVGATLKPTIIGFGAVLDSLSAFLDRTSRPAVIAGMSAVYVVLWIFVAGGIIDRYARGRPTRAHGFFSASGVFFVRFVRLGILQLIAYSVLFGSIHSWLFDEVYPRSIREMTAERDAFFVRVALYCVFGIFLVALNLLFDYAKVRAIVEDRRSMVGALGAAIRFLRRNPAAWVVYLLNGLVFLVVIVGVYGFVAPGAGGSGARVWMAFVVGQLFVLARLWVKLAFWASETALFQGRLAHAGYVGTPRAVWPDSPGVEAIKS